MSNLTIAVDEAVVKAARLRAIAEGTSVSARVRDYLADYGRGAPAQNRSSGAALLASEPLPRGFGAQPTQSRRAKAPRTEPATTPTWLAQLRERVQAFGGAEPADWLAPRDKSLPRNSV